MPTELRCARHAALYIIVPMGKGSVSADPGWAGVMVPLTNIVDGLIKTQGFHGRMVEFSLQQHWGAIVGPHIAAHTFPESIRHRKLFLVAENSVWLQQLRRRKPGE